VAVSFGSETHIGQTGQRVEELRAYVRQQEKLQLASIALKKNTEYIVAHESRSHPT
jgi:hypothetical protein